MATIRKIGLSGWTVGVGAVFLFGGCSGVQFGPRYGTSGTGPSDGFRDPLGATILVEYEATCEDRCSIWFSLPGATPGAEQFKGRIRRNIRFPAGSARGITMTVEPLKEGDLVRRAQIQIDGVVRAYLQDRDIRVGRAVTLTTALVPRRRSP